MRNHILFRRLRLSAVVATLFVITGCSYQNPYETQQAAPHPGAVVLERAYLGDSVAKDGLVHVPTVRFVRGRPIYLTVVVSGKGAAEIEARLRPSEESEELIRIIKVSIPSAPSTVSQELGEGVADLPPGAYYLSIVLNGTPSWGISFQIVPDGTVGANDVSR